MITIGITGGMGSGKSIVAALLTVYGIPVYNADSESKRLLLTSPTIRRGLTDLLGADIYSPDGTTLRRAHMASLIFADPNLLARVNAIIHPEVGRDFDAWRARLTTSVCAMESAILFESGFDRRADLRLMVYAPEAIRLQRVMARDNATEAAARQRMQRQWPDGRKIALSDAVITNDGRAALIPQVEAFVKTYAP
ncbi:dephospho-CoA kinase [Tannerella sp. oral taxon 808]|nr:dephospho-CoA kinase [Tannerella sp. oral taxon 808]